MPIGPRGEKRPVDVVGNAIMVAKIATGEIEETYVSVKKPSKKQRLGAVKGAKARTERLSPERRSEIARKAANVRWGKTE